MNFLSIKSIVLLCLFMGCDGIQNYSGNMNSKSVFAIIGAADFALRSERFNRWNTLVNNVHVFAYENEFLASLQGQKHVTPIENLPATLIQALVKDDPQRLTMFLSSHGAKNGNLCYVHQNQCDLTEDVLIDMLIQHAKTQTKLKHVLIIPLSCFNKIIMERFAEKLKRHTWPFSISYMLQTHNYECSTQSAADSLMNNMIIPFGRVTEEELDEFIALTTLEEFVDFHNRLATSKMSVLEPNLHFELRNHNEQSTIKLADFGFDMLIFQRLRSKIPFPSGSLADILTDLGLKEGFHPYVERLDISFENNTRKIITVKEVKATVLDEPDLMGKPVINFAVILRKTPIY